MLVTFEAKQSSTRGSQKSLGNTQVKSEASANGDDASDQTVIQNINQSEPPDSKVFSFTRKKSKGGCITCKIRKKRCSDERPICSDCKRLGKNCVWATAEMTIEKIKELKKQVEMSEEKSKLRKRQSNPNATSTAKRAKKVKVQQKSDADQRKYQETSLMEKQSSTQLEDGTQHEDTPLDSELSSRKVSTPVSSNLMNFPSRLGSPHSLPMNPTLRSDLSSQDVFYEFSNFFENNLKNAFQRFSSDKISELDISEENEQLDNIPIARSPPALGSALNSPPLNLYHEFSSYTPRDPFFKVMDLDPVGVRLYDYYQHRLSRIMSIVPAESNYFTKVFLPMATTNRGILYSIMAWSAYHIGGDLAQEGAKYMDKALNFIKETPIRNQADASQRLANLLILCGAEICKGDVRKWPVYLQWGSKVIKDCGGLSAFNKDKTERWLITNFSYHDILASSTSERGTYFPLEEYNEFLLNLGINPLTGIIKPLFKIIGEISTLALESKKLLDQSLDSLGHGIISNDINMDSSSNFEILGLDESNNLNEDSNKKFTVYESLIKIMKRSSELENLINSAKPDTKDLRSFTLDELEFQLTLFESFQLTAKLHLRQSVLKLNPSSLETQFILCELLKCLDIVLGSPVESSLCFPLFIAGMNCTTQKDRRMMLSRFNDLIQRYSFKNVERAKMIMEQVWLVDPTGTKCVDWYEIVKKLGWDLSFA